MQALRTAQQGCRQDCSDSELQGFPTVPSLATFHIYKLSPSGEPARYLHLASMLRRHAGHLRDIELQLTAGFLEGFPAALPACRKLSLLECAASSTGTLALLRSCALPALEELRLELMPLSGQAVLATLQEDLGWLAGLPALQELVVVVQQPGVEELQQALVGLLPGKEVQVAAAPAIMM